MPDFSKDGQWTVYVTLPEASLVRSRIDGRDRIQLTSPPMQATLPKWSPDGEEIAFMARMPGEREFGIYLVSALGSNLRLLQPGLGPSWSPDGRYLLFEQWDPSNPDSFKILDLKTNQVTAVPASENKTAPRWSPDGRYIAATADGWSRVVVFDSETRVWRTLATYRGGLEEHECRKGSGDGVFFPTWSHDGQSIFYVDWTPGKAGIYRVALAGDEPETIIYFADPRTPPHRFYSGTLGGWFGLAPDDSLLFAVHASEEEIYAIEWEEG
jgi:Tol biopolymer transport system component